MHRSSVQNPDSQLIMTDAVSEDKTVSGLPDVTKITEVDEDAAIDGVDPIYAAKARVLNRAVSPCCLRFLTTGSRDRHGKISMAAVLCHRLRMVRPPSSSVN